MLQHNNKHTLLDIQIATPGRRHATYVKFAGHIEHNVICKWSVYANQASIRRPTECVKEGNVQQTSHTEIVFERCFWIRSFFYSMCKGKCLPVTICDWSRSNSKLLCYSLLYRSISFRVVWDTITCWSMDSQHSIWVSKTMASDTLDSASQTGVPQIVCLGSGRRMTSSRLLRKIQDLYADDTS